MLGKNFLQPTPCLRRAFSSFDWCHVLFLETFFYFFLGQVRAQPLHLVK